MGGQIERIVLLTGLALCVMNGAVTDGDRFVFSVLLLCLVICLYVF